MRRELTLKFMAGIISRSKKRVQKISKIIKTGARDLEKVKKVVESHKKEFGAKHAKIMKEEIGKGKTVTAAHKAALKKAPGKKKASNKKK